MRNVPRRHDLLESVLAIPSDGLTQGARGIRLIDRADVEAVCHAHTKAKAVAKLAAIVREETRRTKSPAHPARQGTKVKSPAEIRQVDTGERAELRDWLDAQHIEESSEFLATVDEGVRSAENSRIDWMYPPD